MFIDYEIEGKPISYSVYDKSYRLNHVEGVGEVNSNNTLVSNMSSILTELIHEVGRLCDNYASDLFIWWESVENYMAQCKWESRAFFFGLRKMGVDDKSYIANRLYNSDNLSEYREVLILRFELEAGTNRYNITLDRVDIIKTR